MSRVIRKSALHRALRLRERPWARLARRMRRDAGAAASLALTLAIATPAKAQQDGWLLAGIRRTIREPHIAELVDLRTGARRALPMGQSSLAEHVDVDVWSASRASARTLLRTDNRGNADFFDSESLRPLGSFSLASLPRTRRPIFVGTPRLSPDGQYVLTYWMRDVRAVAPELTVFDRQGHELRQVRGPADGNNQRVESFAWTPRKGRFVFLDDDGINICQLDTPRCLTAPLRLPPGVGPKGASLDVSPDGQHLALVLGQFWRDSSGRNHGHSVLFAARLDGTGLHQLTTPSKELQDSGTDIAPLNPRWSPDGRRIAFTPRWADPSLAWNYHKPCAEVRVVDADGTAQELGAAQPPQTFLKAGGAPVTICSFMEWVAP